MRWSAIPREDAVHPPRTQRPGDSADLVLLEEKRTDPDRSRARPRTHIDLPGCEDAAHRRSLKIRAQEVSTAPPRRPLARTAPACRLDELCPRHLRTENPCVGRHRC